MGSQKISIRVENKDLRVVDGELIIVAKCPKCKKIKDVNSFGLRKMSTGEIRRQSYCRTCRSSKSK